ncbi:MAG: hypothetical protein JHC87_06985 [Thermoleophilaceae bacterium]|nr:hypothetical protein [Thermoleophilaceae bacterium]
MMRSQAQVVRSSHLAATRQEVWNRISTPAGVNYEFGPLMRMTFPKHVDRLSPQDVPLGEKIGRCWILLFGIIPLDYDDLVLVSIDEGHGFHEKSKLMTQRRWEHERTITSMKAGGCVISDRLTFEPRLPLPGKLFAPIISAVFAHRHRRLRQYFHLGRA